MRSSRDPLHAHVDFPLPTELGVGAGTALFVCGWCFDGDAAIRSLSMVVDGERQPLLAFGTPRRELSRGDDASSGSLPTSPSPSDVAVSEGPPLELATGFWGFARLGPGPRQGRRELRLHAGLQGGGEAVTELARIETAGPPRAAVVSAELPSAGPLVAICMATRDPPPDLISRQLDSIRAQTHRDWICVISDESSRLEHFEAIHRAVRDDPRFIVSRSPHPRGFYLNFERALSMAPADAKYVALADQDDFWYPEKLEVLLDRIGDAELVYSDARVIDRKGEEISDTYWNRRRNNHSDLLSLMLTNAVTGAAALFRKDLLDYALPFPPAQFAHYHDHWIAVVALALGDIAFVDRPLYDYVQHSAALLGHARANQRSTVRDDGGSPLQRARERLARWRGQYFVDACRLMQFAAVLEIRCGSRLAPAKRRSVDVFLNADRSARPLVTLGRRAVRELFGPPETLGAEWMLFRAYAWRRLLGATARLPTRVHPGATPPRSLTATSEPVELRGSEERVIADKIAPLYLSIRDDAPRRVNILIPTIDLEHFFGGYIAKFNLARRLAESGVRTRVVTVDPVQPLPRSWIDRLESYSNLAGVLDKVEVAFGREQGLEVSRADRFIATTWWTAHIAHGALRHLDGDRFVYLIQEYEPFTFPMGTYAALARESYGFPHFALFSSELLRDYFRRHGIGVYTGDVAAGDAASVSFENAITAIEPPTGAELAERTTRNLLFYARPEAHAARNMFELGVLALRSAVQEGAFQPPWELHGVGSVGVEQRITLGNGAVIRLLPRSDQHTYAQMLRRHDAGLALMYTPHPSLTPIEMASAGIVTVTNSFENKTRRRMAEISTNLITADPSVAGIASALIEAVTAVEDVERRVRGSAVRWSRDWNQSFSDELLARLVAFLGV